MATIIPRETSTAAVQKILLETVTPRPIALASTLDRDGNPNLAPFSFFNVFSAEPPILVFSPARRIRDNTTKHTLSNISETMQVAINLVNYDMVYQMSLSSTDYPRNTNEFEKSGFTMSAAQVIKPFLVQESPVQLECLVKHIIPLGAKGGAGFLVVCEVVVIHIEDELLSESNRIDPNALDLVARMGADWYSRCRVGAFKIPKPTHRIGIGFDQLPDSIRNSNIFTGNDLGKLAQIDKIPNYKEALASISNNSRIKTEWKTKKNEEIHTFAKIFLNQNDIKTAWHILIASEIVD